MSVARVILKPHEDERIRSGHPWVFDNEIAELDGRPEAGDAVDVESHNKHYVGRGFYNPHSKIRVRVATHSKEGLDSGFWKRRLRDALSFRSAFLDVERDSYRLLFAEADRTPGLIVDIYHDYRGDASGQAEKPKRIAVLQCLCYGVDLRRDEIAKAIREVVLPDWIVERSDAPVRLLEGLEAPRVGGDPGSPDSILIRENGLWLRAKLLSGQKTGSYLDQRENRAAVSPLAPGRQVLDAFCNSGGFGLCALKAGAAGVDFVDSSEEALASARENAELNGFSGLCRTVKADVFDFLKQAEREKRQYGLAIVDPPAFAKSRDAVEGAYRGYKDINYRAMRLLSKGGWLVSCSCSHHFGLDRFLSMIKDAAADAERPLRIAEIRFQAKDHPMLSGYPESQYLKCVIAQAL
jgi:23S rRNA (cytosine1962-C5)-methyltransferase